MNVTSVVAARAIWLFDTADLNPSGRYIFDHTIPWLIERYQFASAPAHVNDRVDNGWEFKSGKYVTAAGLPVPVVLKIFNDGMVAETSSSTDDAEAFLADVLSAAVADVDLTFHESMVHRKMYVSELNLASEGNLSDINSGLRAVLAAMSDAFGQRYELVSLGFGVDPPSQPTFRFERRVNAPLSQNYYWSLASLQTRTHIALLNQLEHLLLQ